MSRTRRLVVALLLGALAACKSSAEPASGEDSLFVNTMADLRRIRADPTLDSAGRDSARDATLERHGVSADELVEMARELARDPTRALDDWREIERRVEHDTVHAPPAMKESAPPQ